MRADGGISCGCCGASLGCVAEDGAASGTAHGARLTRQRGGPVARAGADSLRRSRAPTATHMPWRSQGRCNAGRVYGIGIRVWGGRMARTGVKGA